MESVLQDLRYGVKGLLHTPLFTVIAVLTMAVGTGANATVFSFVDALLFRPARGVADPSTLVAIYTSDYSSGPYGSTSYPDFQSLGEASAFSLLAASNDGHAVATLDASADRLNVSAVTPAYFDVIGLQFSRGRTFTSADTALDAAPVVVISDRLWHLRLNDDPAAVGAAIDLDGRSYTIVGIAPPRFEGLELGSSTDVWTVLRPPAESPRERGNRSLSVIGRLAAGATIDQAQAQLTQIAERLAREYPDTNLGTLAHPDRARPMIVLPHRRLHPAFRPEVGTIGAVMMTAALLVLLTACANVANLLLTRATTRQREMAIRVALGARRSRLVRQLVLESVVLASAGLAAGLLITLWTADALPSFFPPEQARLLDAALDARVGTFSLLLAFLASLIVGVAPALQSLRSSGAAALRGEAAHAQEGRMGGGLRRAFVIVQVAMAFVLLVAAGLLVRSLQNALDADLGFGARNAALASVEVSPAMPPVEGRSYFGEALGAVRRLPGVEAATIVQTLPLARASRRGFRVDGYQPRPGEDMELPINIVGPDYFETMQIDLLAGRTFNEHDTESSPRVVVVNDLVAARYFGAAAGGRRIRDSRGAELEIVGVVRTGVYLSVQEPPAPMVYYPMSQAYSRQMRIVARTAVSAASLLDGLARELRGVRGAAAVYRTVTMERHVGEAVAGDRLTAALVAACGFLALTLAVIGVYGVVAYSVALRTREIGVRMALGARPPDVVRLVLKEGLKLTAGGAALGAVLAFGATRLLESMLYLVSPTDPATFATVPVALVAVGAAAAWIPVRRALRVEPMRVLRQD